MSKAINIEKLPKHVQDYIKDLERQREVAVRQLNDYLDNQTESPFSITNLVCTGEETGPSYKKLYIQTHAIEVVHAGVELRVLLRDDHIDLSWSDDKHMTKEVCFQPSSYQQARLMGKEFMR